MLWVAVSWDLYVLTKSAIVLGNVGLAQVAPFLFFALFAGQYADRYDRRLIILYTQVLFLVSSAMLLFGFRSVAMIYLCLFLTASARAFQWPARQGMLPLIVPADVLSNAITWNSSVMEIASVTGPALGGILVAVAGSHSVYLVQVVCALLTLACYALMEYRSTAKTSLVQNKPATGLLDGVRFVWTNKLLLPAMTLDLLGVLFGGAVALLPIYAVDILHSGPTGLGWLRAAPSIGAVAMAITSAHRGKILRAGKTLLFSVAGFGLATVAFGASRWFWFSFAALMLIGAFDNISVVLRQSLLQTGTPDRLRGRVLAVNSIFVSCSNQLGAVESGWTAAWFGAVPSVVGGGMATIMIVAAVAVISIPLRNWEQ